MILVKPGTYVGDINMIAGISVKAVGVSNDSLFLVQGQTVLQGTVTFNNSGTMLWQGIDIKNATGVGLHITGNNSCTVMISYCLVDAFTFGLLYDNTGLNSVVGLQSVNFVENSGPVISSSPDPSSILFFRDCIIGFFGQGSDNLVYEAISAGNLLPGKATPGPMPVTDCAVMKIYSNKLKFKQLNRICQQ